MKIALISRHVNLSEGVPRYVAELAKSLAREHQVSVISASAEGLEGTGIRHIKIKAFGSHGVMFNLTFSWFVILYLLMHNMFAKKRFEIVHTHHYGTPFFSNVITSHYCENAGLGERNHVDTSLWAALGRRFWASVERRIFSGRNHHHLIALSGRMKQEFIDCHRLNPETVSVVPNGVDSLVYNPANIPLWRPEIRSRHSVDEACPMVLFVGGDWERKGVPQALEAFARMGHSSTRFLIVGPGDISSYSSLAQTLGIERNVEFVGPSTEAWKYYAASDVFILPSLYEPFGLVALEAMAFGLPVLVAQNAGVAELIQDGVNGLLIKEPTDVLEISTKLSALISDRGFRTALGQEARKTAIKYTWDRVANRTVSVYKIVLGIHHPVTFSG